MSKWLFALSLSLCLASVAAEPVAPEDRVAIDFRRTTLVVNDIERSLGLYRDALGMRVIYDQTLLSPRSSTSAATAERASRLVFLRANDNYVGVLGLLEYQKPQKSVANQGPTPFTPGSSVLLFNAGDLDKTFAQARQVLGVAVLSEPVLRTYPGYEGDQNINVRVSVITDPDGFVIELNQILSD